MIRYYPSTSSKLRFPLFSMTLLCRSSFHLVAFNLFSSIAPHCLSPFFDAMCYILRRQISLSRFLPKAQAVQITKRSFDSRRSIQKSSFIRDIEPTNVILESYNPTSITPLTSLTRCVNSPESNTHVAIIVWKKSLTAFRAVLIHTIVLFVTGLGVWSEATASDVEKPG